MCGLRRVWLALVVVTAAVVTFLATTVHAAEATDASNASSSTSLSRTETVADNAKSPLLDTITKTTATTPPGSKSDEGAAPVGEHKAKTTQQRALYGLYGYHSSWHGSSKGGGGYGKGDDVVKGGGYGKGYYGKGYGGYGKGYYGKGYGYGKGYYSYDDDGYEYDYDSDYDDDDYSGGSYASHDIFAAHDDYSAGYGKKGYRFDKTRY